MPSETSNLSSLWLRTDEPLLWLASAGHETRGDSRYWFDSAKRGDVPHYVIQLTLAGEGFYEREGKRQRLPAGTAFVDRIPGDFRYGFAAESRWPYELAYVTMTGEAAFSWCQRITGEFGHVLTLGPRSNVEALLLTLVHQNITGKQQDRYAVSSLLYELLMTLMSTLHSSRIPLAGRVGRALRLIDLHAGNPQFNATKLAELLECSREHLSRQFSEATGVSIGDYLAQQRLRWAAQQLRGTSDKLDLIAARCGFASASYLCRVFRQRFGVTPADFRRQPWMVTS